MHQCKLILKAHFSRIFQITNARIHKRTTVCTPRRFNQIMQSGSHMLDGVNDQHLCYYIKSKLVCSSYNVYSIDNYRIAYISISSCGMLIDFTKATVS
jgi:hypothetical protein